MQGLGKSLFGCAPENLNMLTPEQRARCGSPFTQPDDVAVIEPRSQVKDPARRAAELADKNTPMRVPCNHIKTQQLGFGGQKNYVPMVDPLCAINGLLNGFHLTNLPP